MADFANTVDIVGDEALTSSIIDRSIAEIADSAVTSIGEYAFYTCSALTMADFHVVLSIENYSFSDCTALTALIIRTETVCTLKSSAAFQRSGIVNGNGYIYVPRALVDSYKAATNWSTYAARFRALEDYTVDGTITGELDSTKI